MKALKHALRAKAVLCPGLKVTLKTEKPKEKNEWQYSGGLEEYLLEADWRRRNASNGAVFRQSMRATTRLWIGRSCGRRTVGRASPKVTST